MNGLVGTYWIKTVNGYIRTTDVQSFGVTNNKVYMLSKSGDFMNCPLTLEDLKFVFSDIENAIFVDGVGHEPTPLAEEAPAPLYTEDEYTAIGVEVDSE